MDLKIAAGSSSKAPTLLTTHKAQRFVVYFGVEDTVSKTQVQKAFLLFTSCFLQFVFLLYSFVSFSSSRTPFFPERSFRDKSLKNKLKRYCRYNDTARYSATSTGEIYYLFSFACFHLNHERKRNVRFRHSLLEKMGKAYGRRLKLNNSLIAVAP